MSGVKLSRATLEAALARFRSSRWDVEHEEAIEAACDALLAVMQPASDEEVNEWITTNVGWRSEHEARAAYREAEARARRLANWSDDAEVEP